MVKPAVPVRGSILGHCYYDGTERDLSIGASEHASGHCASDALPYVTTSSLTARDIYLRLLLPHYAGVTEAYLDLSCTLSGFNGLKVALAPVDGLDPAVLSQAQIDSAWRLVQGDSSPVFSSGGVISLEGLNLKSLLPEVARGELMAIVLSFTVPPQNFRINRLNLLMGVEVLT